MNLSALVLHNVGDAMFQPYHPDTADLVHAHEFQIVADNVNQAGDLVWILTNVDDGNSLPAHLSTYGNQVDWYRSRMNRSLSVGDVIILSNLGLYAPQTPHVVGVLAVERLGFKGLEFVPDYTDGSNSSPTSESYLATFRLHS